MTLYRAKPDASDASVAGQMPMREGNWVTVPGGQAVPLQAVKTTSGDMGLAEVEGVQ